MQDTVKKDFTLRITQANRTELTVIIFDMALAYLSEAQTIQDKEAFAAEIRRAGDCVEELKHSLDFQYEISGILLHVYVEIKKMLARAALTGKHVYAEQAAGMLERLRDAFAEVAKQDDSAPLIENAQTVYAGYTYGKNDVNLNLDDQSTGRGFLV